MVGIVTGNELGLLSSSLTLFNGGVAGGSASLGRLGEQVYVNATSGNLVIQARDELLINQGLDVVLTRTYNSQGQFTDDNGDNFQIGLNKRLTNLPANPNSAGSTVTRINADGSPSIYNYDTARGVYVTTDGSGADDYLAYSDSAWIWTEGTSRNTESYNVYGQLLAGRDTDGNVSLYSYDSTGRLSNISDASGQNINLIYTGRNLTSVDTVTLEGTQTRVRYNYDSSDRLSQVIVDLSPEDSSIADGNTYVTTYTYDGTSKHIASITQGDGSTISFSYDAGGRVTSYTDGVGRTTNVDYYAATETESAYTDITDAAGGVTSYTYDTKGRLTRVDTPSINGARGVMRYVYDASDNLVQASDTLGNTVDYIYDANSNLVLQRDSAGNTLTRTYSGDNQLLTETLYTGTDPDAAGPLLPSGEQTTRYVYDSESHLRFTISATGRVSEYRYDAAGNRVSAIHYSSELYDLSGLVATDALDEAELLVFVAVTEKNNSERIDTSYDYRGQVSIITRFSAVDVEGNGVVTTDTETTYYIYNAFGQLLQTLDGNGNQTDFVYDGLNRLTKTTNANGKQTTTIYDDSAGYASTLLANGLITSSVYNSAGELISVVKSDAGSSEILGTTQYSYDAAGNLRHTTDPSGVRSYLVYDARGRVVAEIDADGSLTEHLYDEAGKLLQNIRYATHIETNQLVNADGTPASINIDILRPAGDIDDRHNYRVYDAANRLVFNIDSSGSVTQFFYDGHGQLTDAVSYSNQIDTTIVAPNPSVVDITAIIVSDTANRHTRSFYDADGNIIGELDAAGYVIEHRYNAAGRQTDTVAYANAADETLRTNGDFTAILGSIVPSYGDIHIQRLYNARGDIIATIDGEGYLTETLYDAAGNITQTITYANRANSYNPAATLADLRPASNAEDRIASYTYTALNQLVTATNYEGTVTQYLYDDLGNITSSTIAAGTPLARTLTTEYDQQGRVIAELSAEGSEILLSAVTQEDINAVWDNYAVKYTYDTASRRISSSDQNGHTTLFYYNADGQLSYRINARGEVRSIIYNTFGQETESLQYANRIDTTSLIGGDITEILIDRLSAARDISRDTVFKTEYTVTGSVARTIDALGYATESTYNTFGEVSSVRNENGIITQYKYDTRGLSVQTIVDVGGLNRTTTNTYDAFGRVIASVDPRGNISQAVYDRYGQIVETIDPDGVGVSRSYNAFGQVVTITDALGLVTTYEYDNALRSVTITTANGIQTSTIRNQFGDEVLVTDGNGNTTSFSYNRNGELTDITDSEGNTTQTHYDGAGLTTEFVDARGIHTIYGYDAVDRLISQTVDPGGLSLTTTYKYNSRGQNILATEPNGRVTRTSYDANGRQVSLSVDPDGLNITTEYSYDATGKLLTVTNASGTAEQRVTNYQYDNLDRRIATIVDPDGLAITTGYSYDENGNVISSVDANNNISYYAYDANDRLIYAIDPAGSVSKNVYDDSGRITQKIDYANAIDPGSLPSLLTISAIDNMLQSDSSNDRITSSIYDADGRVVFTRDALDNVVSYIYDNNGNITKSIAYATPVTASVPNTVGAIQAALLADSSNNRIAYSVFNSLNQVVYDIDVNGVVTEYVHDENGNITQTVLYANSINPTLADSNPSALIDIQTALVADPGHDRIVRHLYDAGNREVFTIDAAGYVVKTNYDAVGQAIGTTIYDKTVTVSANPDIVEVLAAVDDTDQNNRVTRTVYDAAGRLVASVDAEGYAEVNNYDAIGNIIAYSNAKGDTYTYIHDAAGRLIAETTPVVSVSRLTEVSPGVVSTQNTNESIAIQYTYNGLGNVLTRTEAAGTSDARTTTYVYDALGRQVQVIYPHVGVYDEGADHTADYTGRNETGVNPTSITTYDSLGNAVINKDVNGNYAYKAYDQLGRLIFDVDYEGYVTEYTFDAFGNQSALTRHGKAITFNPANYPGGLTVSDVNALLAGAKPVVSVTNVTSLLTLPPNQPYAYVGSASLDSESLVNSTGSVTVTPTTLEQSAIVQNFAYTRSGTSLVTAGGISIAPGNVAIGDATPSQVKATLYRSDGSYYTTTYTNIGYIQNGYWIGQQTTYNYSTESYVTTPAHFSTSYDTESLGAARKHIPVSNYIGQVNLSTGSLPADTYRVVVEVRDDAAAGWSYNNQLIDERDGTYVRTTELYVTVGTVVTATTLTISQTEQPDGTTLSFQYREAGTTAPYQVAAVSVSGVDNVISLSGQQTGDYEYLIQYTDSYGKVIKTGTGTFTVSINPGSSATSYITHERSSVISSGSSIDGYVTASQAASVDYFSASVKDSDTGLIVNTAITYPEAISNYAGQVNLSVDQILADGRYTVEVISYYRDGSQAIDTFDYEVGLQTTDLLTSTLIFSTSDQPPNTNVRVRYAPQGSSNYTIIDGSPGVEGYTITLSNEAAGAYSYILDYLGAGGAIASSTSGDFNITEGGTTAVDTRTILTEYDQRGLLTRTVTPSTFNYDSSASIDNAYFDSEGLTTNTYNAAGQIVRQSVLKNPLSNSTIDSYYYYDTRGNQIASIDGSGYLSEYDYDVNGNVTRITEYARALSAGSYGENGYTGVVSTTPQNTPGSDIGYDRITQITYDKLDRKVAETRINVEYSDASYGGIVDVTTQYGDLTTNYAYDAVGNLISTTDATGATTYTYYDALGRTIALAEPARLSEDASGGSLPTVSVNDGVLTFAKPAAGNTIVNFEFGVAVSGLYTSAVLVDKGGYYEIDVTGFANDYYDYKLEFTRQGDTGPYARGTGRFTITGQSSSASQHVVARSLEPTLSLASYNNARVVSDESGTYYTGSSRINLDYSSLADVGEGDVRITVYYSASNANNQSITSSVSAIYSDGSTHASLLVGNSNNPSSYQTITGVNRVVVEKNTGTQYVTIHDSNGDIVANEQLVLQGATSGLSGIDVDGVGFLAATGLADGVFMVDISSLARGYYSYTPVGTASTLGGSFETRGSVNGLAVQEGYHAYTQSTIDPQVLNDEGGSYFGGPGVINLEYSSLEQYGDGDVRIVVDYTASNAYNQTVVRSKTVILNAADAINGAGIAIEDAVSGYQKVTSVNHVQVFKVIDGAEVLLHDRHANSNSGQIEISGIPAAATDVTFEYRVAGDSTPFLSKATSSIGSGWFAVGYDDLVNNNYEYRVTVRDGVGNPVDLTGLGGNADGTLTGNLIIRRGADSLTALVAGDVSTLTPLTTISHDIYGNAVAITRHANGASLAVAQDKATDGNEGFVAGVVNAQSDQHTYIFYDTFGNEVKAIDAEGGVVNTSYNADGSVAKTWQVITDIDGNTSQITTLYAYDNLGRQTATTKVLQGGVLASEQVQYNAHGEIQARGLNGDYQEYYEYDAAGRLVHTNEETGISRTYLYNLAGKATADLRSANLNLADDKYASSTYLTALSTGIQRTETVFDDLGRIIEQRQADFISTSAGNSIAAALRFDNGILSFEKPAVAGTVATVRYALLGTTDYIAANIVDNGDHYEVALPGLVNDYYSYDLSFTRTGDTDPYATGTGVFTVTGQGSTGSQHVVGVTQEPVIALQSFSSARTVSDESGTYYTGTSSINISYSSLAELGEGDVIVTAYYSATNANNQSTTSSVSKQLTETSTAATLVIDSGNNNASSYKTITGVNRIVIQKYVGDQLITIHDTTGDNVLPERLLLQGNTTGLTSINVTGVGNLAATAIGGGLYSVDISGLARGTYSFTPVGTASTVAGSFEAKGSGGGLAVQEGHHTYTQAITNPDVLSDESGSYFSGLGEITIGYNSLEHYGAGNVRIVVNYTAKNANGQTTSTSQSVSLSAADGLTGTVISIGSSTAATSYNQVSAINHVYVYKVIDGAEVLIQDRTGNSTSGRLEISGIPASANSVTFEYRREGGITSTYLTKTAGSLGNGFYGVGYDDLPVGRYVYRVTVLDLASNPVDLSAAGGGADGVFVGVVEITRGGDTAVPVNTGDTLVITPTVAQVVDRYGNVISVSDPRNAAYTALYRYDYANNIIEQRLPEAIVYDDQAASASARPTTTYAYDRAGRQIVTTDANGHKTGKRYDSAGQLVAEHSATGGITTHSFNALGQRVATVDANNNITSFSYDRNGRITTQSTPELTETYVYDEAGNRIRVTNAKGESTDTFYDTRGNVVSIRQAAGQRSYTTYDLRGHRIVDTDANGKSLTRNVDYFGKLTSFVDLVGDTTTYTYNYNGQTLAQTSTSGQSIGYQYYDNGKLQRVFDNSRGSETYYSYDAAGNTTQERYTENGVIYQDARTTYDALGRVIEVQDNAFTLTYGYDAVGNRRFTKTGYYDYAGVLQNNNNYYLYDADNRITLSKGVLNGTSIEINQEQGIQLFYDAAGNRRIARFYEGGNLVEESYLYDGNNRLISTNRAGLLTSLRTYDNAGRVIEYSTYTDPGQLGERRQSTYNANGQLLRQDIFDASGQIATLRYDYVDSYDAAGNVLKYSLETTSGTRTVNTYIYSYLEQDSYKESTISGSRTIYYPSGATTSTGVTTNNYDVNGNLVSVTDSRDSTNNQTFVNNIQGQILVKTQNGKSQNYYYAEGKAIGSQGELSDADFDYNYTPVNESYPATTPGAYVVSSSDTLQSISLAVYGDASLWYIIADANGLRTDADLVAGQSLKIPNTISNINNNTDTFKPYNAGDIIGDTTPTLPDPPPPPASGGGCGGFGQILVVIVTIVVAIYLPEALHLTSLEETVLGAAAANIAGQVTGNLVGIQNGFDFKSFASSVLTAGLTEGIAGTDFFKEIGKVFGPVGQNVVNNLVGQGVRIVTGQQDGFDFKGVAATAISAPISDAIGNSLKGDNYVRGDDFLKDFTINFAQGAASEIVRVAVNGGGKFQLANVAGDAFGNALGYSIVRANQVVAVPKGLPSYYDDTEDYDFYEDSLPGAGLAGQGGGLLPRIDISGGAAFEDKVPQWNAYGIDADRALRGYGLTLTGASPFGEYSAENFELRQAQFAAELQVESDINEIAFNNAVAELRDQYQNDIPIFHEIETDPVRKSAARYVLEENRIRNQARIAENRAAGYVLQPGDFNILDVAYYAIGGAVYDTTKLLYDVTHDFEEFTLNTVSGLIQFGKSYANQYIFNTTFGYYGSNDLGRALSLYGSNLYAAFDAGDNQRAGDLLKFLPELALGAGALKAVGLSAEFGAALTATRGLGEVGFGIDYGLAGLRRVDGFVPNKGSLPTQEIVGPYIELGSKEAMAAQRVYHQSFNSREALVIGRLEDTAAGAQLGVRRLNDPDWTINVNDSWVHGGIDAGKPFYLGSNISFKNLRSGDPVYPKTVFFRELSQLRDAGYFRQGDWMLPPTR